MALPVIGSDGDLANAAMLQRALTSNSKPNIKIVYARIRYTGSIWEVVSTTDSSELVSGNLVWSTDTVLLTLTGYTVAPVVLVSQAAAATIPYAVQAHATSDTEVAIQFWTLASVLVTTEDTNMDIQIIVIGA